MGELPFVIFNLGQGELAFENSTLQLQLLCMLGFSEQAVFSGIGYLDVAGAGIYGAFIREKPERMIENPDSSTGAVQQFLRAQFEPISLEDLTGAEHEVPVDAVCLSVFVYYKFGHR